MTIRVYILIGLVALASVIWRNEDLFLTSVLLALVATAAWLWSRYCLAEVSYVRHFGTRRLYLGEETDLRVEIVNAKPLPLPWLRADDGVPPGVTIHSQQLEDRPGGRQLVNVLALRWYERVIRRYTLRGLQRGVWPIGPLQLRSGDIFGFSIRRETIESDDTVMVYPRILPVSALKLPVRHPLGNFRSTRRIIEDPLRLMSVRDYAQGDNFRHIHWKATARRQALQTKVFEPSASQVITLFLNINTSEHYYEGFDVDLREYAISAATSLAQHLWAEGHPLGFYCNAATRGTAQPIRIPARTHPEQLGQILAALARIDDGWGRWPLDRFLQNEAQALPYGATVVVISAVMNPRLTQTLLDLRRREFGVFLITLGDGPALASLPNLPVHHIGGRKEWHEHATLELA